MAILHGRARFPGLGPVLSAEYTNSHGTDPGVAVLEVCPQPNFPAAGGTLLLTDGLVTLNLPGCRVAKISARRTGLTTWQVAILDRRWKWQGGYINGHYNTRDRNGVIKAGTEATPQQLATLLFRAMGETSFSIGALPNDARPQVDWVLAEPARALTELCDRFGCRPCYFVRSNLGGIVRVGVGAALPKIDVLSFNATIDPPERPDQLIYAGGRARWQAQFYLDPVGLDTDGKIKTLRDLSYRPTSETGTGGSGPSNAQETGFENSPRDFSHVVNDHGERDLARLSVFRWYRIKMVDPSTIKVGAPPLPHDSTLTVGITERLGTGFPSVPGDRTKQNSKGSFKVKTLDAILPIEDQRITPGYGTDKAEDDYAASVQGYFMQATLDGQQTTSVTSYRRPYTIDRERGLVIFRDQVTMRGVIEGTDKIRPAILWLNVAFAVQDDTREPLRYVKQYTFPGPRFGGLPRVIHREEAVLQTALVYPTIDSPGVLVSNKALLDKEADYYLQAQAAQFQTLLPEDVTYMGLKPIDVDGAIWQVTYTIGPPTTTRASRNTEHHLFIDDYRDRQRQSLGRSVLDPEFIANVQRQLEELRKTGQPLGPGLRGV